MKDKKTNGEIVGPEEEIAGGAAEALVESPDSAVQRLEAQLNELQDRYLRMAAEYENYRKRAIKERTEAWHKAQVDLLGRLADALDDLARFTHVDPARTDPQTIYAGVDMVERKLWKELEATGLRRLDQAGVPFDPQVHEAVSTKPAEDAAHDRMVGAVLQPGYKLGDTLVRPARVQVLTWEGEGA
jgi:molecular chaperone GrpE